MNKSLVWHINQLDPAAIVDTIPNTKADALVKGTWTQHRKSAPWSTEQVSCQFRMTEMGQSTSTFLTEQKLLTKSSSCHSGSGHSPPTHACLQIKSVWSTVTTKVMQKTWGFVDACYFLLLFLNHRKCPHKSILNCEALLFLYMAVSGLSAGAMSESTQTPKKDLRNIVLHMTYGETFTITKLLPKRA